MSRIAAIGAAPELLGYALLGVDILDAPEPESVRAAWATLSADVELVLLTPEARRALPGLSARAARLWAEVPA